MFDGLTGPRICLGQSMAYVEAKIVTTMILQKFKVIVSPGLHVLVRPLSAGDDGWGRPERGVRIVADTAETRRPQSARAAPLSHFPSLSLSRSNAFPRNACVEVMNNACVGGYSSAFGLVNRLAIHDQSETCSGGGVVVASSLPKHLAIQMLNDSNSTLAASFSSI